MPLRYCHACGIAHDVRSGCPRRTRWGGRKVQDLRRKVLARDQCTCQRCGRRRPPSQMHVDHITPRMMGGPDTLDNLQALCAKCNLEKGSS